MSIADTAHIVSRCNKALRWELMNLLLLCRICHSKCHDGSDDIKMFVNTNYPDRFDYLFKGSSPNCNLRLPKMTEMEMIEWLRITYKMLHGSFRLTVREQQLKGVDVRKELWSKKVNV